jgi:hypothetical protein
MPSPDGKTDLPYATAWNKQCRVQPAALHGLFQAVAHFGEKSRLAPSYPQTSEPVVFPFDNRLAKAVRRCGAKNEAGHERLTF